MNRIVPFLSRRAMLQRAFALIALGSVASMAAIPGIDSLTTNIVTDIGTGQTSAMVVLKAVLVVAVGFLVFKLIRRALR